MAFYETAFGLSRSFLHEGGDCGEMATGETRLAFLAHALMASLGKEVATTPPDRPAYGIALETDDVPAALARALAAGAAPVQEARAMPWGQITAYVRAPEGTLIEICTPGRGALRQPDRGLSPGDPSPSGRPCRNPSGPCSAP